MSRTADRDGAGSTASGPAARPVPSPTAAPSRPVLASLLGITPAAFAADHWGRQPLLTRAPDLPGTAQKVLDLAAVDELLSERGLRTPFLRLTRNGEPVPAARYTSGGGAGASINDQVSDTALTELLLDGTTLVLQGLHRTWRPVADLVSGLSEELGVPVQANAYITPPDSRGFDNHYDVHDVFVVQLSGRKHWRIHAPVFTDPLPDQPWTDHREAVAARIAEPPLLDTVLEPGDVLYLPRGTIHGAVTEGDLSAHLTLGVHPVSAASVATAALAALKADPRLRASLPLGQPVHDQDEVRRLLAAIAAATAALDAGELAAAVTATVSQQTRPEPVGPLAQARAVVELAAATRIRLRPGLQAVLREGGRSLQTPTRAHTVAVLELRAVEALLAGETLAAGGLPGLDGEASLTLARRLLRAGVATLA